MARKPPTPTQQATGIVSPQYRALDYAQARAAEQTAKQNAALVAARNSLIKLLQGGVEPAGRVYDQAVGQQQALAQAGAAGLAQANPNAQIQASLGAIGAPAEQQSQLANLTQGAFPGQGAVLNVVEGTVPGAGLVAQKAAAQQFLAGQPLIAGLSGDQSLRALAEAAQAQRDKYLEGRMQIASQIPQLATQLQQQRVENQQADRAFRFQQQQFQQQILDAAMDRQFRAREAALDRQAQQATTPYQQAQIALEKQRIKLERQQAKQASSLGGDASLQLHNNPDGSVSVFNPNTGESAVVKGPPKAAGTSGMTQTQIRSARAKANQLIGFVRDARAKFRAGDPDFPAAPTYNQAVRQALKDGIPLEIAVPLLNRVFPAQYRVTAHGLEQIGIRGQPSTFEKGNATGSRNRRRREAPRGPEGPVGG